MAWRYGQVSLTGRLRLDYFLQFVVLTGILGKPGRGALLVRMCVSWS